MDRIRRRMLIVLCTALAVVTAIFIVYRWREHVKSRDGKPVIVCPTDRLEISVGSLANDETLLYDVAAVDAEDGDISERVVVESISRFIEKGHCIVTYAAVDSDNNVAKKTRHVYFLDYISPRFELTAPLEFSYSSVFDPLTYIRAYDCIEGDISSKIRINQINAEDNIAAIGTHAVEIRVTNSFGDIASIETEIIVYDRAYTETRSIPIVKLDSYIIYVEQGDYIDTMSLVKGIAVGGVEFAVSEYTYGEITIDEVGLDLNMPGVYRVVYTCTNGDEYSGSVVLTVVVTGGEG